MRRTYNEIGNVLRKAAMGAGFPAGLAEDAARAGTWLARNGFDGVAGVLAGIAGGMPDHEGAVAFEDVRVAVAGPCVLDLIVADRAQDGVMLTNADAPWMLVGLAGAVAGEHQTGIALEFSNGAVAIVTSQGSELQGEVPEPGCDVTVRLLLSGNTGDGAVVGGEGFDVTEDAWRRATALAARTYVPASEASRERGAGAGMTDND